MLFTILSVLQVMIFLPKLENYLRLSLLIYFSSAQYLTIFEKLHFNYRFIIYFLFISSLYHTGFFNSVSCSLFVLHFTFFPKQRFSKNYVY